MKKAKKKADHRASATRYHSLNVSFLRVVEERNRLTEELRCAEAQRDSLHLRQAAMKANLDAALAEIRTLKADVDYQRRKAASEAAQRGGAIGALRAVIADLTADAIRRTRDEEREIRRAADTRQMVDAYRKNVDTPGGRS